MKGERTYREHPKSSRETRRMSAEHRESVPVTESYLDQIMWEGVVEVFDLDGHPTAKRAYGWQFWEGKNAQYTVVLGIPPIDSPSAAVRASIAAEAQQMHRNSQ